MSRYVDVNIDALSTQVELQTKQYSVFRPGDLFTSPQWWARGVTSISPTMRAGFPGFVGYGTYKEVSGISIELFNPDGSRFAYLGLAGGLGGGTAYGPPVGAQMPRTGRWHPSNKPVPHSWVGLMAKGGGGLVVGGEGQVAALLSCTDRGHGCGIGALGVRGGASIGGAVGLAVVFATGFTKPDDFSAYTADGLDWALSFGGKWADIVKGGGKLGTLLKGAHLMLERLDEAARFKALKDIALKPGVETELYGIAKGVWSATLVDTDYQSITVIDIPMAGVGVEIGVYYAKTGYRCLSDW